MVLTAVVPVHLLVAAQVGHNREVAATAFNFACECCINEDEIS